MEKLYQKRHPDCPWLTKQANNILESHLKKSDRCLEFGAGRSTIWLAKRSATITSIECDMKWYLKVSELLDCEGLTNVNLVYLDIEEHEESKQASEYILIVESFAIGSLDFVLIDGLFRDKCANAVLSYVKPGGIIVLDDASWHLPSNSISPGSRSYLQGTSSAEWGKFLEKTSDWRYIWTSDGVKDTAIFFKPCSSQIESKEI